MNDAVEACLAVCLITKPPMLYQLWSMFQQDFDCLEDAYNLTEGSGILILLLQLQLMVCEGDQSEVALQLSCWSECSKCIL